MVSLLTGGSCLTISKSRTYSRNAFNQRYYLEYNPEVAHWCLYVTDQGAAIFMAPEFEEVKEFVEEEITYQSSLQKNKYGTQTNGKWTSRDRTANLEESARLPRFRVRG